LLENPAQFDLHQICPKFVAFRGPDSSDPRFQSPEQYCELFVHMGVNAVVRLNETDAYDSSTFVSKGIQVHELKLEVAKIPSAAEIEKFLEICDGEDGVIGVHCTGGRGRTATMIGVWMMRRQGWSARDAIAWLRIVRPGSILGNQQEFLESHFTD
jgi:cell division cycle 14